MKDKNILTDNANNRIKTYNAASKTLNKKRQKALNLLYKMVLNTKSNKLRKNLKKLFKKIKKKSIVRVPFFCEYGYNISIGKNVFINHNCVFLDPCAITIGNNVFIGPNVHLYTVNHPLDEKKRLKYEEICKPIIIKDNVWIGGNSVILPGITIGKGAVIGAGSVVTKNIPKHHLAYGNPAKIIRFIGEKNDR